MTRKITNAVQAVPFLPSARATYNSRLQPLQLFYTTGTVPPYSNLQSTTCSSTVGTILHRAFNFGAGTNDNGNVLIETNCRDTNRTENFVYDSLNRISLAYTSGTNWGDTFTIDAWGNLTNIGLVSGKSTSENLNAAPASIKNQLNGYCHDSAGNLVLNSTCPTGTFTPTYSYDSENRLASTAGWTYSYDGDGKRLLKCNGSACTLYWTGTGNDAIAESNGSTFSEEYAFFNGKRVARRDLPSGTVHYYFSDHLGSASVITDSSGSVQRESDYYPYGGEITISGSDINRYKFTGKERDFESGLDYFGARYYGSKIGRFMIPDWADNPSSVPYADFSAPQSLNAYGYTRNNPLTTADVDGHCPWCIVLAIGAAGTIYEIYHFATKNNEQHKEAGQKQESFLKNPSSAPIEDLTAPVEADLNMARDAGVLAIENMNPPQGAETTIGAAADLVSDQLNQAIVQSVLQNATTSQNPPIPLSEVQGQVLPEDYVTTAP